MIMSVSGDFDIFTTIRKGKDEYVHALDVSKRILDPNQYGYFDESKFPALALLVCTFIHAKYTRNGKILRNVHNILSDSKIEINEILDLMMLTTHDENGKYHWRDIETKLPTKTHPVVFSIAQALRRKKFSELEGI